MRQLTEEIFPHIKPPFVLESPVDKEEARKWIVNAEAEGNRPAVTRTGTVCNVVGEGNDRIVIVDYNGIYVYIFNDELLESDADLPNEKFVNKRLNFKLIGKHNDKVIGSCKSVLETYKIAMLHGKILKGKILEIKQGRGRHGEYAIVLSKGDKITIPASEFALPTFLTPEEKIGHIVDFVILEVRKNKVIGSTRIVEEYRKEQLKYFFDTGETFKAEVEKTAEFGAFLTYKHNNGLILRNKDFSSNFTYCKEVLEKGDTVNVKIKSINDEANKYVVELVNKYYVEPTIKLEEVERDQEFDGEVVRVEPFGCFVRIGPGRDVLCPINSEKREPVGGDNVRVKIVTSNADSGKLRGQIIKYNDELVDLSEFNLI